MRSRTGTCATAAAASTPASALRVRPAARVAWPSAYFRPVESDVQASATECTKIGICYRVNDELKATIQGKVERFRQTVAEARKAGKAARADLPKGSGADYMLMWTTLLEGSDGTGG